MMFPPQRHGFTLLEVILVVTIISIVSISGFSAIVNLQRTARINGMYDKFLSFLDIARSYSINGKLVSIGCPPDSSPCIPKNFGAEIRSTTKNDSCSGSDYIATLFYEESLALKKQPMDSFCIHPQTAISSAPVNNTPLSFSYAPPFGLFTSSALLPNSYTPVALAFCDKTDLSNKVCNPSSYLKKITLYAHVGVPE